jgi:hypothetical protein
MMTGAYGIKFTPTILVIDGQGLVRYATLGEQLYHDNLKGVIDGLVRERAVNKGELAIPPVSALVPQSGAQSSAASMYGPVVSGAAR